MYAVAATNSAMTIASRSLMVRSVVIALPVSDPVRRRLFHDQRCDLPDRTAVELLALELGVLVVGVDHEQRTLVAHRHVFAVALEREDDIVLREVLDRDLAAVVVQRDDDNAFALGSDRLHQLV